ncbi:MAG: hypothetical protein ACMUIS_09480 [bacterium]
MPFKRIPGLKGRLYIPEPHQGAKKHDCPDCHSCQRCSDRRCSLCRAKKKRCPAISPRQDA